MKHFTILFLASIVVLFGSKPVAGDELLFSGKLLHDESLDGSVESVAFSPDGIN